jgi:hypothetical protein
MMMNSKVNHGFEGDNEMQTIIDRIAATPAVQQPKKVGPQEFKRMCKRIMTPVFKAHWTHEVWKRGESITEFRQMENDLDETGEEQTHLLVDSLRERGVSDAEMLNLSWGDIGGHPDDSDEDDDMEGKLHARLSWDLPEAFGVLVRNAPKNLR